MAAISRLGNMRGSLLRRLSHWAEPAAYGTHTMRRTEVTLIYRQTKNLGGVQLLLGYPKLNFLPRLTMSY